MIFDLRECDRCADVPFACSGFDFLQLRDGFGGNERRELFIALGYFEAELGCPSNETGIRVRFKLGQQFGQRSRAQELLARAFIIHHTELGVGLLQPVGKVINTILRGAASKGAHGGIMDWTIAGAAAEIASELFIKIVVGVEIVAVVALEH